MDEYVVGSVADLISNSSHPKVKTKKRKLKLDNNDQCENTIELFKNNEISNTSKVKTKKKNNVASLEVSVENDQYKSTTGLSENNETSSITKVKKKKKKNKITSIEPSVKNDQYQNTIGFSTNNETSHTSKIKTKNKNNIVSTQLSVQNDQYKNAVEHSKNNETSNITKVKNKKKKKNKVTSVDNLEQTRQHQKNNETSHISKVKTKKKDKAVPADILQQNLPSNTQQFENIKKIITNINLEVNKTSKLKKRKKSDSVESEKILKKKRPKNDLLAETKVPSDSENDDDNDENLQKNSNDSKHMPEKHVENKKLNENTVFIGNIPINYDKQKICKAFSKFGEIQNARIRCVPVGDINMSKKVAAIKKKFNPKRNSLVAYVNFKSLDSAKAAVEANGMVIDGHHLRVDFANNSKERDNNKAVFVGGLPFDIEDDELWEFFQTCGTINSVRIIRDSQTSMGKGFGYVNFDSSAAVELALQLNGEELKKRVINVKRCINVKKKKLNTFNHQKSKEMANQLLCKRGKKFKEEKKKFKKEKKSSIGFQGRTANMKQKKKKKLSQVALRQRKLAKKS